MLLRWHPILFSPQHQLALGRKSVHFWRASVQHLQLQLGMLLQLKVETQAAQALVIPESAIIPINQKQYVYQIVDKKVQRAEVVIGRRKPGLVEVLTGLTQGDEVVTQGVIKVRPGSMVTTEVK